MVQSPSWEANWFAASQEIPRISRNPKVHYRTHKRPPPVSILGQPNPVHIPTSHLLQMHLKIIHPSTPRSPQWSPSLWFPHQDPIHPLSSPIRATFPAHLILLDFITRTILGEQYKSFSSSLCNLLHSPVTSVVDDGQRNCPKNVEFYSKKKFEKLVDLVGFIIRIYHDARSAERQIFIGLFIFSKIIFLLSLVEGAAFELAPVFVEVWYGCK